MGQQNNRHGAQGIDRRKGCARRNHHGLFIVDKPRGISSFDVVKRLRRSTGIKKIGHTGTLDPLATGVLPVCVGEATKLAQYLVSERRRYHGEFLLGLETDTDDITGNVIRKKDAANIQTPRIRGVFQTFVGIHPQLPPQFSALKYRGRPAYYWARKGIAVPLRERPVTIEAFHLTDREDQKISFDLLCLSGTYVRALAFQVGRQLECGACLSALRRVECGSLLEEYAVPLERLEASIKEQCEDSWLWPMTTLLPTIEPVVVEAEVARKLLNGASIPMNNLSLTGRLATEPGSKVKVIYNDTIIAVAEMQQLNDHLVVQPRRILHTI